MRPDLLSPELAGPSRMDGDQKVAPVPRNIGFVGLGRMGSAMAANLAAANFDVTAFVRRREQMDSLEKAGIKPTQRRVDLYGCDVVVSMLPDDAAVSEVFLGPSGLAAGMKQGAIHLSMSTISTTAAAGLAKAHGRRGQRYVAAPVFGNPDAAKDRLLFVIAAGTVPDIEVCRPLFTAIGQKTFVVGTDPSHANLIKLLGNAVMATTVEMLGETVAVMRKRGLDPELFVNILTSTLFGGRAHKIYGDKIVHRNYAPGFALPLALKDVRLALAEAGAAGVAMPSVEVVQQRMNAGIARGHAALDWSALGLIADEVTASGDGHPAALF
jgi:3-hydroxyisobutyrate dehydrogenase-like beta-hydroxyacid dehydrogenase